MTIAEPATAAWEPKQCTDGERQIVDLENMPPQTATILLTEGGRGKRIATPQIINLPGLCVIGMSWNTDVLHFPIQCATVMSKGFVDTQGRWWERYIPDTKLWKITPKAEYVGTVHLVATGDSTDAKNEGVMSWTSTATILDIPGIGLWQLVNDEVTKAMNGITFKMQTCELL